MRERGSALEIAREKMAAVAQTSAGGKGAKGAQKQGESKPTRWQPPCPRVTAGQRSLAQTARQRWLPPGLQTRPSLTATQAAQS